MKYIYVIALLLIQVTAVCQTLDKLDNNNGFKKFKFGSSPSQFTSIKENKASPIKLKGVKNYIYSGDDIKEVHGVRIETIYLFFYKNRLYQINVSFGSPVREYTVSDESMIQYGLESNYGYINHDCRGSSETGMTILGCTIWDGRKVRLEHVRVDLLRANEEKNERYNYIKGYILFTDKATQKEQQESEVED
jgi:hypothetical protein